MKAGLGLARASRSSSQGFGIIWIRPSINNGLVLLLLMARPVYLRELRIHRQDKKGNGTV